MSINPLNRFLQAQEHMYATALCEIKNGEKESCWMWYIFPQLRELAHSEKSHFYGIDGLKEAREYLAHPVLSARLIEITQVLLLHKDMIIEDLIGDLDVVKLQSSMTLFALLSDENSPFHKVLDCFYGGQMDEMTLKLVKADLL